MRILALILPIIVASMLLVALTAAEPKADPAHEAAARPNFSAEQLEFFERQVRPILTAKCVKCHGGEEKIASNFYLTSRAAVLRGGDLGPAVDLKDVAKSQLIEAIHYNGLEMPPSGKLPPGEIDVLTQWVKEGLPWTPGTEKEPPPPLEKKVGVTDEDRAYWAYQPVRRPSVPEVKNTAWVRTPIDAFILAKLEAAGLAPSGDADPRELLRRATYDLTGLPPTPEEASAEEWVRGRGGEGETKYMALVDQLLASPHYGEKWGRHWLDLVRYAETHGFERDSAKPFAWRYRDYVIDAFNQDKPYDDFIREQLAGDELDEVTAESLIATGYYRLGIWDDEPADRELAKYDVLDGVSATTCSVMLGMSMGCARCHTHKKDPIPHRDYYRMLAFFRDVTDMTKSNLQRFASAEERRAYDAELAAKSRRESEWYSQIYALEQKFLAAAPAAGVRLNGVQGIDLEELRYKLYRDTWNELPDFDALKYETTGESVNRLVSLAPASREKAIGLVYEGKLKVPESGEYVFQSTAREGMRLTIAGRTVIDRPWQAVHIVEGRVKLEAGFVPFRLDYFNASQAPELRLTWSGPGFEKRSLTDDAKPGARYDDKTWAFVTQLSDKNWMKPGYDDSKWQRGPAGFGTPGTPGAKIGTVWNTPNIYLRRTFRLREVPDVLKIDVHHDEDVTIFLNGKKAYTAAGFLKDYERVTLTGAAISALKPGENVVAVYCKQTGGGQYIDVRIADAPTTVEDLVRAHGDEVLGSAEATRYRRLVDQLNESRRQAVPEPGIDVMCVVERGTKPTHVLLRGLPGAPGEEVTAGVPEVLAPAGYQFPKIKPAESSSGKRRALAEWIVDEHNPLTARVMVNRVWQYHFGRGLVATSNDFGKLGEQPSHPELLDWLADEFVRGGWKLKPLHRLIMSSSVYRQTSRQLGNRNSELGASSSELRAPSSALDKDPDNRLLWHFPPRRLTAEEVRDSILSVSGKLDLRVGGPSVYPPIPREVLAGQSRPGEGWPVSKEPDANRRSVYVHVKRALLVPILSMHDQADTDSSCPVRYTTTVPTQALGMLNGEFVQQQAAALAERLQREAPSTLEDQIRRAIALTTLRTAETDEVTRDAAFVRRAQSEGKLNDAEALKLYCLLTLNANEFLYLD